MFQPRSIQSSLSFRDKLVSIDYVLVISILILGIVLVVKFEWEEQEQLDEQGLPMEHSNPWVKLISYLPFLMLFQGCCMQDRSL